MLPPRKTSAKLTPAQKRDRVIAQTLVAKGYTEILNFPFHQRLIEKRTSNLISEGNKKILWGCKPRSGKTYMSGLLIISQHKLYQKYKL